MRIGYARVSTKDQSLILQLDALQAEGCERVFRDPASGVRSDRKSLTAAFDVCASGDVLTVWKLDRLGWSLFDLAELVGTLKEQNVGLKVLPGAGASIETTKPEGQLFFALFAALSEFECGLIRGRTRDGMNAAKRWGRHVGRPSKLSIERLDMASPLTATDRSQIELATALGAAASALREGTKRRAVRASAGRQPIVVALANDTLYLIAAHTCSKMAYGIGYLW